MKSLHYPNPQQIQLLNIWNSIGNENHKGRVSYQWESKTVSDRFLTILSKIFIDKPTVTYKKKYWTHPTSEGDFWKHSTSSQEAAWVQEMLSLPVAGFYMSSGGAAHWFPFGHLGSTGANDLPVLPRQSTALHQVFKPWPVAPLQRVWWHNKSINGCNWTLEEAI